jgi:predicted double-glycine peptidase
MHRPQTSHAQTISNTAKNVAMMGSPWHANINGLKTFLEHVWPKLDRSMELNIYRNICNHFSDITLEMLCFMVFNRA